MTPNRRIAATSLRLALDCHRHRKGARRLSSISHSFAFLTALRVQT